MNRTDRMCAWETIAAAGKKLKQLLPRISCVAKLVYNSLFLFCSNCIIAQRWRLSVSSSRGCLARPQRLGAFIQLSFLRVFSGNRAPRAADCGEEASTMSEGHRMVFERSVSMTTANDLVAAAFHSCNDDFMPTKYRNKNGKLSPSPGADGNKTIKRERLWSRGRRREAAAQKNKAERSECEEWNYS